MLTIPEVSPLLLESVFSPGLIVFADRVRDNISRMIAMAGDVNRLRPHCKTHKMAAVIRLLIDAGISKHKAATIAEVEMLADCGATDVVLGYNVVGPGVNRVAELLKAFPDLSLTVTADDSASLQQLSDRMSALNLTIGVMLDVDVGLHRTGVSADSPQALPLYAQIAAAPGIRAAGFHIYDGHQRQSDLTERREAVTDAWRDVLALKQSLEQQGLSIPELLCGGTPTFPVYCKFTEPEICLSPGTSIFHDAGYGSAFPDLEFAPAAVVITRVISRPTADRVTLDLGNKSVAADPPKGRRVLFPELPDAEQVIHNEEHLVLQTPHAEKYRVGDVLLGIPIHICPTSALHEDVTVIDNGRTSDSWRVTARNRCLTH
ncbi:MAG: D-TA family PLP-dependent enzyme [Planctomycetaceae bacterium]|nr:D-TA family PLP-dependent enzyme [Planctomycetaceae bacterium]